MTPLAQGMLSPQQTADALPYAALAHEIQALLQAGIDVSALPTLADVVGQTMAWQSARRTDPGPVFFKSCGWAGWDLAAARCIAQALAQH